MILVKGTVYLSVEVCIYVHDNKTIIVIGDVCLQDLEFFAQ